MLQAAILTLLAAVCTLKDSRSRGSPSAAPRNCGACCQTARSDAALLPRQHTSAYVRIRQSACCQVARSDAALLPQYVSIRQHTSALPLLRLFTAISRSLLQSLVGLFAGISRAFSFFRFFPRFFVVLSSSFSVSASDCTSKTQI